MAALRDKRVLSPERRERLRQVIIELFAESSCGSVGLREICERANVTQRTIYKHFGNKHRLLITAIAPDLERLSDMMWDAVNTDRSLEERTGALLLAYTGFYLANRSVARVVFLNIPVALFVSEPGFVQERQMAAVRRLVEDGRARGEARTDIPLDDVVDACAAVGARAMQRALTMETVVSDPRDLSKRMWRVVRPLVVGDGEGVSAGFPERPSVANANSAENSVANAAPLLTGSGGRDVG